MAQRSCNHKRSAVAGGGGGGGGRGAAITGGGGRGANGSDAFGIAGLCLVVGVGVGMVVAAKLGLRGAR